MAKKSAAAPKKAAAKKASAGANKTGLEWLRVRMDKLGYRSLEEVAQAVGINRGNLYRYFTLETRPSVARLPELCSALKVTPLELLRALEVLGPNDKI